MSISTKQKQTHRHREQTCGYQGGGGRDKLGVWDQQIQTTTYKIDNNKVLLYSTGNYIQYLVMNYNGKESKKKIYIYITESLCCTAEINSIVNQLYFPKNK